MGDELGGLCTSLALLASLSLILSFKSVVVMEWKGMSTAIATTTWAAPRRTSVGAAVDVLTPFHSITTTDSVESISGGPVGDLQGAPARCSIRPVHRPTMQVAACSCGDASHGRHSVTSPCRSGKPPQHVARGFRRRRRPVELPFAPDPGFTAQTRAHGSKFQLHPSSWAQQCRVRACGLLRTPVLIDAAIAVLI